VTRERVMDPAAPHEDLLVPIFRGGNCVYQSPSLTTIRDRAAEQINLLHPTHRRLVNPHEYPVGLEKSLAELRTRLLHEARQR
jgi:nicotinate phosphoribosyltransferase